jgi:hypothetical protein
MATTRQRIQLRRDTAAAWTAANPVLLAGELGFESDTGKLKAGNGSSAWTALAYINSGTVFDGTLNSLADVNSAPAVEGSFLVYQSGGWVAGPAVTVPEVTNGGNF